MKTQFSLILFLIVGGLAMAAAQEIPQRLSSLSHGPGDAGLHQDGVMMGGMLYYSRQTVTHGTELWKTDGTAEGTRLVRETIPGVQSNIQNLVSGGVDGGTLYFATTGRGQPEIWKTDGTEAGTVPVVTQWPEKLRHATAQVLSPAPGGGALFVIFAHVASEPFQIWKTDGTQAGTVPLTGDQVVDGNVRVADGTIWMDGPKLWKSDGTTEGTVVSVTPPAPHLVRIVWAMDGSTVLFTAPHQGKQMLQRLDATGTTPLKETGTPASTLGGPVFLEGDVHFLTHTEQNLELWRSDGTEDGTTLVKTLPPTYEPNALPVTTAGGKIYFHAAPEDDPYQKDLWVSDGTEAGTLRLGRINSSPPTSLGDKVCFVQTTAGGNHELWTTDGTVDGTIRVAELGPSSANPHIRMGATASGLILAGNSTVWKSDGTAEGTMEAPVGRILGGKPIGGIAATADGQVLFSAHDATAGQRLWRSDGTPSGTVPAGGPPGTEGFRNIWLDSAVTLDGISYFAADDGVHGIELWRSDGTEAGTRMVKDIRPLNGASSPSSFTIFKGAVWFSAEDSANGRRLWRTDGTETGTHVVAEVGAGGSAKYLELSEQVDGHLDVRFSGYSATPLETLGQWRTDGTPAGTVKLPADGLYPAVGLEHQGHTYYWVGSALWKTDGTPEGAGLVHQFPYAMRLIAVEGKLMALDQGSINAWQTRPGGLWRIRDDVPPELLRSFITDGTTSESGGVLHFHVTSPVTDAGLWRSDGTVNGTYRLRALTIDGAITPHHGKLYFSANDGAHGEEPWVSDGTAEGTQMLADLTGDSGGSSPSHFTPAGGKVFFAATTETEGPQLYVVDAAGVPTRYDLWLDAHRAEMNGRLGRGEDADDDGYTNLQEFAFGGNPADGAVRPDISSGLVPSPGGGDDGEKHLSLTLPVRRGAVFLPGRPATGAADGVIYRILATEDLANPAEGSGLLEVLEDTSDPHPPHPDEDYEYRTFRLDDPVTARERAFLRVVTE